MGASAFWSRDARHTHGGVRCLGGWGAGPRRWASASRCLRRDLLRVTWGRLHADWRDAEFASARVPRRRDPGTVVPRQRHPMGDRASGCRAEVVMTERVGSHGDSFWEEELPLRV